MAMPKQQPHRSKQDYATPMAFILAAQRYLYIKRFTIDFAADRQNAKAPQHLDERMDALSFSPEEWADLCDGGWGWLNPPYTNIGSWAEHCLAAMNSGAKIAFLVPASVGSNWFRDYIHEQPGVKVLFLNGRLSFTENGDPYPKDLMLVLFGGVEKGDYFYQSDVWNWRKA